MLSQYAIEDKGKAWLVFQVDNQKLCALTWDDIFKSFETKLVVRMLERSKHDRAGGKRIHFWRK